MSEENEKLEDDFIDEEEYKKALAALETSKSIRLKENTEKKKKEEAEKKAALKAKRQAELEKKLADSKVQNKFLARCIADPIIPACIIAAVAIIIGIALYILIPMFSTPAMKYKVSDFRTRYASTEIYQTSLSQFGFAFPEVQYFEGQTSNATGVALTADPNALNQVNSADSSKLNYFGGTVINSATSLGFAVQGSERKSDGKITALRVMVQLDPNVDDNYYNMLLIYFASYFQAFYPNLTSEQAVNMAQEALNNSNNQMFVTNGEYAYRVVIETTGAVPFVALDIVPAASIK